MDATPEQAKAAHAVAQEKVLGMGFTAANANFQDVYKDVLREHFAEEAKKRKK